MEVSGLVHAQAPGYRSPVPIEQKVGWAALETINISCPYRELKHESPVVLPYAIHCIDWANPCPTFWRITYTTAVTLKKKSEFYHALNYAACLMAGP